MKLIQLKVLGSFAKSMGKKQKNEDHGIINHDDGKFI